MRPVSDRLVGGWISGTVAFMPYSLPTLHPYMNSHIWRKKTKELRRFCTNLGMFLENVFVGGSFLLVRVWLILTRNFVLLRSTNFSDRVVPIRFSMKKQSEERGYSSPLPSGACFLVECFALWIVYLRLFFWGCAIIRSESCGYAWGVAALVIPWSMLSMSHGFFFNHDMIPVVRIILPNWSLSSKG